MSNPRFRRWIVYSAAAVGAVLGGVLWGFLSGLIAINGKRFHAGLGPPLDSPLTFAAIGGLIASLVVLIKQRKQRLIREELSQAAEELDAEIELGAVDVPAESRPKVPLFKNWTKCANRFRKTIDGCPAEMFDLTCTDRAGENTTVSRWTVIVIHETGFPAFVCLPKLRSTIPQRSVTPAMSFDVTDTDSLTRSAVARFDAAYQLTLLDHDETMFDVAVEKQIRSFFVAPRLDGLANSPNWYIQSHGGSLVLACRSILPPSERVGLWCSAEGLFRTLAAPVSPESSPIPSLPGMGLEQQKHRLSIGTVGKIAGAFVGFVGTFFVFTIIMIAGFFRQGAINGPLNGLFAAHPFAVLAGTILGGAIGSKISRRYADRTYRPSDPKGPPRAKVDPAWMFVGAFLGWTSGMLVVFVVHLLPLPRLNIPWLEPILFFAPCIGLLVGGGALGYRLGKRKALAKQQTLLVETDL